MRFVGRVASRGSLEQETSDTTDDLYMLCASVLIGQAMSDYLVFHFYSQAVIHFTIIALEWGRNVLKGDILSLWVWLKHLISIITRGVYWPFATLSWFSAHSTEKLFRSKWKKTEVEIREMGAVILSIYYISGPSIKGALCSVSVSEFYGLHQGCTLESQLRKGSAPSVP